MSHASSLVACVALVALTQGCTLIGLGVGLDSHKYESSSVEAAKVEVGQRVRARVVWSRPLGSAAPDEGFFIEGHYLGIHDGNLELETDDGERHYPLDKIAELQVKVGSHWLAGLLVGAAIDTVIVIVFVHEATVGLSQFQVGSFK